MKHEPPLLACTSAALSPESQANARGPSLALLFPELCGLFGQWRIHLRTLPGFTKLVTVTPTMLGYYPVPEQKPNLLPAALPLSISQS